jgi:signal transduction histidine kinase
VARSELAWLTAACAAVAVVVLALMAFTGFQHGYEAASADAAGAELAASRLDGLQSAAVAGGRLPPGAPAQARRLLRTAQRDLGLAGTGTGPSRRELRRYYPAVQRDLRLVAAGRVAQARRADIRRVDPDFRGLNGRLRRLAAGRIRAAAQAGTAARTGGLATVGAGFILVLVLLLRFAATRRALATAELRERLLSRSDRLRSELISVVSHDLRTPLTIIIGYLEILADAEAGPLTSSQRTLLGVMRRKGAQLLAIVDELLHISGIQEGRVPLEWEEVCLAETAADAVGARRGHAAAKGISLSLVAGPCPAAAGDRRRIGELLDNLLSNALKFTPPGGSVAVAVHPVGDHVRLEVSDTGPGISAEDQEHLFERFYRSPEMAGLPGVGLGLAIVKSIADAHQARLGVRSDPGCGATFLVDFPTRCPGTAHRPAVAPP